MRVRMRARRLAQVSVGNILLNHALGVEERAVDGDGVLHHFQPAMAAFVVHRKNHAL